MNCFLNKYWCNEHFGICYPLLKEVDISKPIKNQKNYNNNYARYWIKPVLEINGKHYIICSQWFKSFKSKLDEWIENNSIHLPDNNQSLQKMNVYVLPKLKTKTCLKCGNKTEREILLVTYHTATGDINNQLFTRRCKKCEITYMADTIFRSYTRSKKIDDININFIAKDTL